MNNNYDDSDLVKIKKIISYLMLGIIYLSFIFVQISIYLVSVGENYYWRGILFLPAYIAILIVPIMFLLYLFLSLKIRKLKRHKEDYNFRDLITPKSILIFVSLLLMAIILIYQN